MHASTRSARIGVALSSRTPCTIDVIIGQARRLIDAGVRSAWFGQRLDYDAISLAAIVGREVAGLIVGTSAVPVLGRHPLVVSSQAQTAQAATEGRFQLGLALGSRALAQGVLGLDFERSITGLREYLLVVRAVLEEGAVDFTGETVSARSPSGVSVPGAHPITPVLVAAMAPQALRAAGELSAGTLTFLAGPRTLAEHIVPVISKAAREAGRPAPRIVALVPGVVSANADAARPMMARHVSHFERVPSYRRVLDLEGCASAVDQAVIGDEAVVAAAVRRYLDAGATEVVFTQTDALGPVDQLLTWKVLGELG
ncbi:MAG: LLM class F420-dependent oxidoreductase [Pseudonocardia sp. SCN 72-86]|nr:MAG: LLM class F420-dependent oxidoreductase [Pseudonocardia sp. SCN 72-86]